MELVVTCGIKFPNVLVVSRRGEIFGICYGDRKGQYDVLLVDSSKCWENGAYHVISDVHAHGSSFVVHKRCRVGSEGRQADIQHAVIFGRQGKGWGREWRLHVLSNVVKFTLNEEEPAET